jgi:kynureninase
MYARAALLPQLRQPIWGWLGRSEPFAMAHGYQAAEGVARLLSGTPPVLACAAVEEGVRLVAEAGIKAIRAKAVALGELAVKLFDAWLRPLGASLASPRDSSERGAHVSVAHPAAAELCGRLAERGVIADFRRPDVIRLGLSPLTTRYVDVWDGLERLRELIALERPGYKPGAPRTREARGA